MSEPGDVQVIAPLSIKNNGPAPIARTNEILGSAKLVADLTARDAIPAHNRQEGMLAYVVGTDAFWQLKGGILNTHWTVFAVPGSGDMLKSVYDTDSNGIVDKAEALDDGGTPRTYADIVALDGVYNGPFGEILRMGLFATVELTGLSGPSVAAPSLIPAGSLVLGVITRVTAAIGITNGTTSFDVGDGSDVDRWAKAAGITLGSTTGPLNFTDNTVIWQTSPGGVIITANGGSFDGTGAVRITVAYISLTPPTS